MRTFCSLSLLSNVNSLCILKKKSPKVRKFVKQVTFMNKVHLKKIVLHLISAFIDIF